MATRKNSKTERKSMNGPMEGQSKTNQAMARQAKPSEANARKGKAEIQDYRVLYSDADGLETKKTVDVPTRETSLIGLNKSTTYTIKMSAFTSVGDGPSSCGISLTTAEDSKYSGRYYVGTFFTCRWSDQSGTPPWRLHCRLYQISSEKVIDNFML